MPIELDQLRDNVDGLKPLFADKVARNEQLQCSVIFP